MFTKNTKPYLLLLSIIACAISTNGQSYKIWQKVLGSAGASATIEGKIFEYTLGEVAILTLSNSNQTLTQGFHQPETNSGTVAIVKPVELLQDWGIRVFPNPTREVLYVQSDRSVEYLQLKIEVINIYGNSILSVSNIDSPIRCNDLAAGYYLLRLHSVSEGKTAIIPFVKIK